MTAGFRFDEIGYWSEVKLEIQKEYAKAYSTILSAQKNPKLTHVYVDAFAGAGVHLTKQTREFVPGSPLNALSVEPAFHEYHLIDIQPERVEGSCGKQARRFSVRRRLQLDSPGKGLSTGLVPKL